MQFKINPEKKKAELANSLGLDAPAISKILAGGREIKAKEYVLMREFFGLPNDGKTALKNKTPSIQPYAQSKKKGFQEQGAFQDGNWSIPQNLLFEKTKASPDKLRIFKISEAAMAPDFKKGDHVLLDTGDTKPTPSGAFLISDGLGEMVRYCAYLPHSNPPQIKLSTASAKNEAITLDLKDGTIIGRVIARLEWL